MQKKKKYNYASKITDSEKLFPSILCPRITRSSSTLEHGNDVCQQPPSNNESTLPDEIPLRRPPR